MSGIADFDHAARPSTAQPPPVHVPGGVSVHDLAILDAGRFRWRAAVTLLLGRKAFGLAKYKTHLQVQDPARKASLDLLEELGDATVYALRAAEQGVRGMRVIYWVLLAMTQWVARRHLDKAGEQQ